MIKKIIIFAPHQDDEILACAGTISLYKKMGTEIFIVFATNGDFYGRSSAVKRLNESITALKRLDIDERNIIVLGFADTGMDFEHSFLWRLYHLSAKEILKSNVSDRTYHPFGDLEYPMQKFGDHYLYTHSAFAHIIEYLIQDINPDVIFTSSRLDAHGDHSALCMFIEDALKNMQKAIPVFQYIIHSGNDKMWPQRDSLFYNRPENISKELWKRRIIIPVNDDLKKRALIQLFESQISPSGYLLSFAKREEIFFDTKEVT